MKNILIVTLASLGLIACRFNGGKTSISITKSNGQTVYLASYPTDRQSDVEDYLKDKFEADVQTVDVPTTQTLEVDDTKLKFTIVLKDGETRISYLDQDNTKEAAQKLDQICEGISTAVR